MYLFGTKKPRKKDRTRSSRKTAAHAAKNRRRVNRMAGKRLSARRKISKRATR